MPADKQQVE